MNGILEGVRVLDFGRYIAGPYCAALLAEFGADVIRIERRSGGEDRTPVPVSETRDGAGFLQMNRNKRGMTLDPTKPEGREIVRRLVKGADVVIANLPPQTLTAMGLDYETLKSVKPDIILSHVTAFGQGGPYSDRVGFDGIGQVMSGAAYMTSEGDGERPFRFYSPWVDFGTAVHCAYGVALALLHREKTGVGQLVEGSLLATALTVSNGALIEQAMMGVNRKPSGNRSQTAGPNDIFRAKDGWVLVQTVGQAMFDRWARMIGVPEWSTDPRFQDDMSRGEHGVLISERMNQWCSSRTCDEIIAALEEAKLPGGKILAPQQTLDDPHVQAMGFLQPLPFPGAARSAPVSRAAVKLSAAPGSIRHRAPLLGEHTDAILGELGYDAAAIQDLRDKRII